ncbi:hypothetical protein [Shewanella sp. KJ2020]|uniref:hypothetical protein n=1 Tax=Shewanella sp. KJ2020 TaxID=2919172 RepID=UPI0020A7FECF|nr:hypothetical protein [Shewanella sp. KJ2020]MCP3130164.1 hypothetical protein [Shewanella sp. KJ2020]
MSTINPNSYTIAKNYANVALTQLKSSQSSQANNSSSITTSSSAASQDTVTLSSTAPVATADTYSHLTPNAKQGYTENVQAIAGTPEPEKPTNRLEEAMQAILDKRTGVDREKLKQLEEKMAKIAADNTLSEEEKAKQIALLQAQKVELIKEASEKNEERQRNNQAKVYYS